MGKMILRIVARLMGLLVAAACVYALGYLALSVYASLSKGYTWQEMDWNQKGSTSIADFFAAADIGKREVLKDGKVCVEYFTYKSGRTVKLECPRT
jgi:hypothetical protein